MKKTFILILVMCLASMIASAQWKVDSVSNIEPNKKLLQVLETDKSVLIFATLEEECDEIRLVWIDKKAYVKANGKKYKILKSVNLPVEDESENRYAVFGKGTSKINFIMEFEKFPVEDGFDVIENPKEDEGSFNFHGVKVSRIDESKVIDTESFLDDGAPVIVGKHAKGGMQYLYFIRNGVCLTCNAVRQEGAWFAEDEVFYVDIVNDSDHGIMFDLDKVSVVGYRRRLNGSVEKKVWTKFSPESYEQYLAEADYDEARYQSSSILNSVGRQIDREKNYTELNSWERIGWEALRALNEHAIQNRVDQYMKAHPKNRPSALRTESVKPGESLHGYIASRKQNADEVVLTIPIDGYDFEFNFNLK